MLSRKENTQHEEKLRRDVTDGSLFKQIEIKKERSSTFYSMPVL